MSDKTDFESALHSELDPDNGSEKVSRFLMRLSRLSLSSRVDRERLWRISQLFDANEVELQKKKKRGHAKAGESDAKRIVQAIATLVRASYIDELPSDGERNQWRAVGHAARHDVDSLRAALAAAESRVELAEARGEALEHRIERLRFTLRCMSAGCDGDAIDALAHDDALADRSGVPSRSWKIEPDAATLRLCCRACGDIAEHTQTCNKCEGGDRCPFRCECICHCKAPYEARWSNRNPAALDGAQEGEGHWKRCNKDGVLCMACTDRMSGCLGCATDHPNHPRSVCLSCGETPEKPNSLCNCSAAPPVAEPNGAQEGAEPGKEIKS